MRQYYTPDGSKNGTFRFLYRFTNSSYRAETLALRQLLHQMYKAPSQCTSAEIFTDNLSLITKLTNVYKSPNAYQDPLILDILESTSKLGEWGIEISLHWIPGHSGYTGNEEADKLTQEAYSDLPRRKWKDDALSRDGFRLISPWTDDFPWKQFFALSHQMRRTITRALTEQGNLRAYTYHYDDLGYPLCRFCQEHKETVEHILI